MNIKWLQLDPQDEICPQHLQHGLRLLMLDAVLAQSMFTLTGGAFLVAYALILGASNTVIGLLAAIGPVSQILQIPAIYLTDAVRRRKAVTFWSASIGRLLWIPIAALPFLVGEQWRIPLFMLGLFAYSALGAVAGCAWNSWMRDLIPEKIMGQYFGKRMTYATAFGAALSLLAAKGVDFYSRHADLQWPVYSGIFAMAGVLGVAAAFVLARVPEPRMPHVPLQHLKTVLLTPLRDQRFRKLLLFMGWWSFSVNLAAPFFTVYLLRRIGLEMSMVITLSVLGQIANVFFFQLWGRLADRFSNKSVLTVSGSLFAISTLLWPFTTMPDSYVLTIPLILLIHILAGISTAGVVLTGGNLALKLAPYGRSTAYLAVNGLVNGLAATIAPILAGFAADGFELYQLRVSLTWISDFSEMSLPAMDLKGLDFLFIISGITGFYALHRLLAVEEGEEVHEKVVWAELYSEVLRSVNHISNTTGLRHLYTFPYESLSRRVQNSKKKLQAKKAEKKQKREAEVVNPSSEHDESREEA